MTALPPDHLMNDPAGICELYWVHGMSIEDLAEHCDVSPRTVHVRMSKNYIPTRPPGPPKDRQHPLLRKEKLTELREEGLSMLEIAEKAGVTHQAVSKACKQHGVNDVVYTDAQKRVKKALDNSTRRGRGKRYLNPMDCQPIE